MRSLTSPIYAYCFFDDLVFIYSFYAIMFSECGLSALQISVLFAVWSTVAFLLEVPSGALADKYSRKHILILAQAVRIVGYAFWAFMPTFWGFLVGFACWGVKSAFTSGTLEALVYDELKHIGAVQKYARIIGRTRCYSILGVLVADLSAIAMIGLGYKLMILASLLSLGASCVAIALVRPADRTESTGERLYLALLTQGVREAFRNRAVTYLILFCAFALSMGALDEYWTLLFTHSGVPKAAIGMVCACITGIQAVAGVVAHRFEHLSNRTVSGAYLFCGVLLLIGAYAMRPAAVVCVAVLSFVWVVVQIVMDTKLQHAIEGDARATVLSVRGVLEELAVVHVFIGFGGAAHAWGYRSGFLLFAGVIIAIGAIYTIAGQPTERRK